MAPRTGREWPAPPQAMGHAPASPEDAVPFPPSHEGHTAVIDLYTWSTPNGRKVSIALEEFGLDYETHAVNIGADEQFHPDFLKISPNNKIPAIVDRDNGLSLMESGAILLYLAEKTGKFMPLSGAGRWRTVEWLMWQMGGAGPMLGQVHHFVKFNPGKSEYAERRFRTEADRLYGYTYKIAHWLAEIWEILHCHSYSGTPL